MGTLPSNVDDPLFRDPSRIEHQPELRDGLHSAAANAAAEVATWADDHEDVVEPLADWLDVIVDLLGQLPNAIGQR